ncbi:MAG: hypothetical protein ACKVJE_17295 [Pseudomonadales bacterium]
MIINIDKLIEVIKYMPPPGSEGDKCSMNVPEKLYAFNIPTPTDYEQKPVPMNIVKFVAVQHSRSAGESWLEWEIEL